LLFYEHFATWKRIGNGTRVIESFSKGLNLCSRAGVSLKSAVVLTINVVSTHGLQQILFIPHITGSLWALGNLENRQ
jgi:hypothetical protein